MNKILLLVIAFIMLAGCQFSPFQKKETFNLPEVNVGTQGVELSLVSGSPPREAFEENPFNYVVTLSNLGTHDVENGAYSLSYEEQYLYSAQKQLTGRFFVRGKTPYNPKGEERQLNFLFNTKKLGPQVERYPASITFNACYPYMTTAPIIACIDTDLTGKKTGKVCTQQPQGFAKGQGAPVVVDSIESRMMPHPEDSTKIRPEFIFTISNHGTGEVVATNYYQNACTGKPLGDENWNLVSVTAKLSDQQLTCTPTPAKLKTTGETRIVCILSEGIDIRRGTYTSPLTIALDYGYFTSITTEVTIVKPGI